MPIRDTVAVAYRLALFGLMTLTPFRSFSKAHIEITVLCSNSTLGYIQFFPVSTSLEYASMKYVKRDKAILINETCKKR